eukprot:753370-Hanusia_phi.AAC.10
MALPKNPKPLLLTAQMRRGYSAIAILPIERIKEFPLFSQSFTVLLKIPPLTSGATGGIERRGVLLAGTGGPGRSREIVGRSLGDTPNLYQMAPHLERLKYFFGDETGYRGGEGDISVAKRQTPKMFTKVRSDYPSPLLNSPQLTTHLTLLSHSISSLPPSLLLSLAPPPPSPSNMSRTVHPSDPFVSSYPYTPLHTGPSLAPLPTASMLLLSAFSS